MSSSEHHLGTPFAHRASGRLQPATSSQPNSFRLCSPVLQRLPAREGSAGILSTALSRNPTANFAAV